MCRSLDTREEGLASRLDSTADAIRRNHLGHIRRGYLNLARMYHNEASDHPDFLVAESLLYLASCCLVFDNQRMSPDACMQISDFVPWPSSKSWGMSQTYAEGASWVGKQIIKDALDDAIIDEEFGYERKSSYEFLGFITMCVEGKASQSKIPIQFLLVQIDARTIRTKIAEGSKVITYEMTAFRQFCLGAVS